MLQKLLFVLVCLLLFSVTPAMAVDTCLKLHDKYQICLEKEAEGRNMDYDSCNGAPQWICVDLAHCYWNSKTNSCQIDLTLSDSNFDGNVNLSDLVIMKQEFGRSDGPIYTYGPPMPCTTCDGTLSPLGRWCDQLNGTVKDMTTGLVWLKDAGWGGEKLWEDCTNHDDAHTRAGSLYDGMPGEPFDLSDGARKGNWRLPSQGEFIRLLTGDEAIRSGQMYFFRNVQGKHYWTSTSEDIDGDGVFEWAVAVDLGDGHLWMPTEKSESFFVWPLRDGQIVNLP